MWNILLFVLRSVVTMVFHTYQRQRILHHYLEGHKAPAIAKHLREGGSESQPCWNLKVFNQALRDWLD